MMSVVWRLVLAFIYFDQIFGDNILLDKPSIQSSTYVESSGYTYHARFGNDGNTGTSTFTLSQQNPYWQGDLLGFYMVTKITVTAALYYNWADEQRKAFIGVSVADVRCFDNEGITCGQWPDAFLAGQAMTFNCSVTVPVRFVRIWRDVNGKLTVGEVEVEGVFIRGLSESRFQKAISPGVVTSTTSLSVNNVTDCSRQCHYTTTCLAFSNSTSELPNCLLAKDSVMTLDEMWVTYTVKIC